MSRLVNPRRLSLWALVLTLLPIACVGTEEDLNAPELSDELAEPLVTVPARGTPGTLDIGEWNIEFFGSTSNGPTNEPLQLSNVHDVILGADLDIWGLEEVVSVTQFNQLVSQLPGYAGLISSDPFVTSGSTFYSSSEQKVALLFKTSVATVQSARLILTDQDFNFAGRPPLEVTLTATVNGVTSDLIIIVIHAKAFNDTAAFDRRLAASTALKSFLDTTHPTKRVVVLGDLNDDVDISITPGKPSPYKNFVDATASYFFPTKALSEAGQHSTVSFPDMIDHHLITNELVPLFVPGSAEVYLVDQFVPNYGPTTTDHFPTLSRYTLGGGSGSAKVILNEILANEPGSGTGGEFIELSNIGSASANLNGFTLSDASSVRHTFPPGATLAAGARLVVFASAASIPAGTPSASAASTGTLSLANGGDTVTLKDNTGKVLDTFVYPSTLSSTDGVSMNRSPDDSATGTFVLHTTLSSAPSSPGKRVNGTP
jgi:endonuclease/exonuclease/phosphatase family metal-dependent hydrolase